MQELLETLREIGLNQTVLSALLTIASALWILNTLGLLKPITAAVTKWYNSKLQTQQQRDGIAVRALEAELAQKKMESMKKQLDSSWLMEQVTQNQAEQTSQIGIHSEFLMKTVTAYLQAISEKLNFIAQQTDKMPELLEQLKSIREDVDLVQRMLYDKDEK